MKMVKSLVVQCNNCNEIIEVEVDLECVSTEERSMGEELQYDGCTEDVCPICGKRIGVKLTVWEYPVGAVNYHEEEYIGVEIIEGPIYDPYENDDY